MYLLPYLIDGDSRKRRTNENSNPNLSDAGTQDKVLKKFKIEERHEVFFVHVESAQEIDQKIEELKDKLRRCGLFNRCPFLLVH